MDILGFLNYFGITPESHPYIGLAVLIIAGFAYNRISIGRKIEAVDAMLHKLKTNIKVVVTFLATDRPKFDSSLIEAMSPLQIKPDGLKILEVSGFKNIFDSSEENREGFFLVITSQEPGSKLEVENYAVIAYSVMLEEDFMKPIQTYLYNNPNMREVFPYLAAVYIRDKYLEEHPEITQ